jgi:hypothetical protein
MDIERSGSQPSRKGPMANNIQGKIVVITGASSGLGEATEEVDVNEILSRPTRQAL